MTLENQTGIIPNLRNIHGEKIGIQIEADVALNPEIENLMVKGDPGYGKSTIISLLVGRLKRRLGNRINFDFLWFEDAMEGAERELGLPRSEWNNFHYTVMSRLLSKKIGEQERRKRAFFAASDTINDRWLSIGETVSLGSIAIRDRAISSIESMVEQQHRRGIYNTLYIGGPADPNSQKRAGEIRVASENLAEVDVINFIEDNYPITIVGLEGIPNPGLLVKTFFQRQARIHRMEEISGEFLQAAVIWSRLERDEAIPLIESIVLPSETQLTEEEQRDYKIKAAFTEFRMRKVLRLPEDRGITTLNHFDPNAQIELDMTPFITYSDLNP